MDVFFQSVVRHWKGTVAGALLTGMGSDGSKGLKALRNAGSLTVAQDSASSVVYGMPRAAADLGAAVKILPLEMIARELIGFTYLTHSQSGAVTKSMASTNVQFSSPDLAESKNRTMVLLVDDQPMVAEAIRRKLAGLPDIDLHYCADGLEAIKQANSIKPSVILQDLVMPSIDGLDLVRLYRANPGTAETPIIVLSSEEDPAIKSNAFAAGANDYLVKLPDRIELIARIRYHSRAYTNRIQRDEAFCALRESQKQLMEANLELHRLTNEDSLTGLKNRRYFDERINEEWNRSVRDKSFHRSVLLIDVDDFKQYNDTNGHLAGDRSILRSVAETPT